MVESFYIIGLSMSAEVPFSELREQIKPTVLNYVDLNGIDLTRESEWYTPDKKAYRTLAILRSPYPVFNLPTIRAHHLFNYGKSTTDYLFVRDFRRIHGEKHPDLDNMFNESYRNRAKSNDPDDYFDYTGGTDQGLNQYVEGVTDALRNFIRIGWESSVVVTALPDENCSACQSTAVDTPGMHCRAISLKDIVEVQRLVNNFSTGEYSPYIYARSGEVLGFISTKRNILLADGINLDNYDLSADIASVV